MTTPTLSFSLTKRYPGFALECEADFASGRVAIFGPSGSGKTTILDAVAGLTQPDAGEVRIAGETVFSSELRCNLPPEKRRIGYVFQDSALFPHMSVRDNILYGHRLTAAERRKLRPGQLVELLALGALLDRSVTGLSGGERQRVALARALATSPDLLLLDEPLAALDVGFRGTIIRYLKRITRELGTPIVYVSHSMSEVMALAEDVLVVDGGRKVVQAHPSIALAHPAFARWPTTPRSRTSSTRSSRRRLPATAWRRCGSETCCSPRPTSARLAATRRRCRSGRAT